MERHAQLTSGSQCEVFFLAIRKIGLPMSQAYLNIYPFFSPFQFPHSNLECALQMLKDEKSKAREIKQVFRAIDCNLTRMVDYNTFR